MVNTQANILSNFWKGFWCILFLVFWVFFGFLDSNFTVFCAKTEGRSFKTKHLIWEKLCQSWRKEEGFRLLVAWEAESVTGVCNNYSLGTLGRGTKEKEGKKLRKSCRSLPVHSQRHRWGRQPHFSHLTLSPAVTALALSAARDALNDDFFVLLIFSIRFKILHSVIYCQVSSLRSGNCHFKEK